MNLSEINIYPVKSMGGIALEKSVVEQRGLKFDRRWMLIDADKKFLTQREFPQMALITLKIKGENLHAFYHDKETVIPFELKTMDTANVKIWKSSSKAYIYEDEINLWFSEVLQTNCRLVVMSEDARRIVNPFYAVNKYQDTVSFADGYPYMLIGRNSLAGLNAKLDEPVPMNRFRPNFVVDNSEPFAEDSWKKIKIGEAVFHVVKPCDRCVVTTVNQETGISGGKEPLKTLASFRLKNQKVLFGQYLIAENLGVSVKIGDKIEVIKTKN